MNSCGEDGTVGLVLVLLFLSILALVGAMAHAYLGLLARQHRMDARYLAARRRNQKAHQPSTLP